MDIYKMTRKELLKEINSNYFEMTLRYSDDRSFRIFSTTQARLSAISGAKYDTKYLYKGNVSKLNNTKLRAYLNIQQDFLKSSWTTPEGRQRIINNAYPNFKKRNKGISAEKFLHIVDILNSDVFHAISVLKNIPSKIIVKFVKEYGRDLTFEAIEKVVQQKGFDKWSERRVEKWLFEYLKSKSNGKK